MDKNKNDTKTKIIKHYPKNITKDIFSIIEKKYSNIKVYEIGKIISFSEIRKGARRFLVINTEFEIDDEFRRMKTTLSYSFLINKTRLEGHSEKTKYVEYFLKDRNMFQHITEIHYEDLVEKVV